MVFRNTKATKELQKFRTISYLPNWYGINVKSFNSTDLCLVSEFPAMTLSQHSINKAFTTRQIFLCPVLGIKGLKIEKGEHSKADTCWYQRFLRDLTVSSTNCTVFYLLPFSFEDLKSELGDKICQFLKLNLKIKVHT